MHYITHRNCSYVGSQKTSIHITLTLDSLFVVVVSQKLSPFPISHSVLPRLPKSHASREPLRAGSICSDIVVVIFVVVLLILIHA